MEITIQISPGELLDKYSILEIKRSKITDAKKHANVETELRSLSVAFETAIAMDKRLGELYESLLAVNSGLWDIEDRIRACEARGDFGSDFVALARSVYVTNDKRADIKREINALLASDLVEEKSYEAY